MATKYVAAAAIALAVVSQTEATKFSIDKIKNNRPVHRPQILPALLDEEQWEVNAGVSAGPGGWSGKVGISHSWEEEEEQKIKWNKIGNSISKGLDLYGKAKNVGLLEEQLNEEQKLKLKSITKAAKVAGAIALLEEEDAEAKVNWKKIGNSVSKGLDLYGKAKNVGLFEELDEEQKLKLKSIVKAVKVAGAIGLLEEEEEQWEVNAGVSAGRGGVSGSVGVSHSWEEEEEQKIKWNKLGNSISKGLDLYGKAKGVGLFEDEEAVWNPKEPLINRPIYKPMIWEEEEEEQKIKWNKLGNSISKGLDLYGKAKGVGLFEELDEEQKLKLKSIVKAVKIAGAVGLLEEEEEEQKIKWNKIGHALDKGLDLYGKAKGVGLLDEEEWEFNAGVSAGRGGVSGNVGISHSWEEEEQKIKWNKLGNSISKGLDLYGKAKGVGLFDEEEWQANASVSAGRGGVSGSVGVSHSWEEEEQRMRLEKADKSKSFWSKWF